MRARRFEPSAPQPGEPPRPGLYVHVPFCARVCPYCDFAVRRDDVALRETFVESLAGEIRTWECDVAFETVYLGGGTPSILSADQLVRVATVLRESLPIVDDAVWSLEANPEDVDVHRLASWGELGFEVVSLGVQSLQDETLKALGRRHRCSLALSALEDAVSSPLRVSADLIYGHPSETLDCWLENLETVLDSDIEHISCYELTVHEGTPFRRLVDDGRLKLARQDERAVWFRATHEVFAARGWTPYEVSNFARRPEWRSEHNRKYWLHQPYLGLGPSAHSFDGRRRWWNVRGTEDYVARLQDGCEVVEDTELLSDEDLLLEAIMLRLRTVDGLSLRWLGERHGAERANRVKARAQRHVASGLLNLDGDVLSPSLQGLAMADSLAPDLAA